MSVTPEEPVLVRVRQRIVKAVFKAEIATTDFVEVCHVLIPVFDNLGTVFMFAKKEFSTKNISLEEVSEKFPTLRQLVDHDKQCGTVCTKNSCARNLHRLGSALTFIMTLMTELTGDTTMALRDAAHTAYQLALAPIHTKLVKSVVLAGLLALPTRATFLDSIQETEESAKARTEELLPLVEQLVHYIESLYDTPMPSYDSLFKTWTGWGN